MISIRLMRSGDEEALFHAFAGVGWNKTHEQMQRYWSENWSGERVTLLAIEATESSKPGEEGERVVGYGNVLWRSGYEPFALSGIPEIVDLNVLGAWQKRGVGTAIIRGAEELARARGHLEIGIGFGLTPDYGAAQRLYVRLGYVPDGRGVWPSPWGDILHLTRRLD